MTTPRLTLTRPLTILQRPSGEVQLGLDTDGALVLPAAAPGLDAALRALRSPRTPLEVSRLVPSVPRATLDRLLGTLVDAGVVMALDEPTTPSVTVLGAGPLAAAVADVLAGDGCDVRTGVRAESASPGAVVVCGPTAEPDRVVTRDLVSAGIPHLVVRAEPERAVVGPFVVLGQSSCVGCGDLVRRVLDPGWPHLLAQLCRSEHIPLRRQSAWAAATAAAQLAAWRLGRAPETLGATVELDAHTGALGIRHWPRHPDCGCVLAAA